YDAQRGRLLSSVGKPRATGSDDASKAARAHGREWGNGGGPSGLNRSALARFGERSTARPGVGKAPAAAGEVVVRDVQGPRPAGSSRAWTSRTTTSPISGPETAFPATTGRQHAGATRHRPRCKAPARPWHSTTGFTASARRSPPASSPAAPGRRSTVTPAR